MRMVVTIAAMGTLAACGRAERDPRALKADEVLVQVSASGTAENRPDEARLTLGATAVGRDARAASEAIAAKMNAVLARVRALGVKDDDLRTSNLSVQRIDYGPNRGRFQAENTLTVRLRDVKLAGRAVAEATAAGANVLSGPDFRVSDPEAAAKGAYAAAYRAARVRVDAYAGAAGMKVSRVLSIRDGAGGGSSTMAYESDMAMQRAPAPMAAPPPVMAGTGTSEASVTVEAALAPK